MVLRFKNNDISVGSRIELLDFLRGVSNKHGVVNDDISLVVPVQLVANAGNESVGVPWTFSTFDLDRFDERVDPQGWELSQYKNNPVIQWAHRFDIPAIGRSDELITDDKGLHGTIVFNDKEYDSFGWSIGERVKHGVLRAGSVGFRILEIELPSKEAQADGTSLIFRRQELLEFSICNVPANPFALQGRREEGEGRKGREGLSSGALSSERGFDYGARDEPGKLNFWGGMFGM
jgi:HK97 family phage prohead protease